MIFLNIISTPCDTIRWYNKLSKFHGESTHVKKWKGEKEKDPNFVAKLLIAITY
jgi:hypothetical protein